MTITESGLTREDVAVSLYRAYMIALGAKKPDWEKASGRDEQLFLHLSDIGGPILEQNEGQPLPEIAKVVHKKLNAAIGYPEESWETCDREHQLAMEAVTRHLFFLVDSEDDLKMQEMEERWRPWVEERLAKG